MHVRKRKMFEMADGFVALPGGIGTLEELVEQLTWVQLGRHKKPILIANIKGYWDPLLTLIEHMRAVQFVPPALNIDLLVAEDVEEILPKLRNAAQRVAEAEKAMTVPARADVNLSSGARPLPQAERAQFVCRAMSPVYAPSRKNVTTSMRLPSGSRMNAA